MAAILLLMLLSVMVWVFLNLHKFPGFRSYDDYLHRMECSREIIGDTYPKVFHSPWFVIIWLSIIRITIIGTSGFAA